MNPEQQQQQQQALDRLRSLSGRSDVVCEFCLRYQHWDFDRALEMAKARPREKGTEGDRRTQECLCPRPGKMV